MARTVDLRSSRREMFRVAATDVDGAPDLNSLGIESDRIREGTEVWDRLREGRPFPMKSDIDPLKIPAHLLPHIILIDVIDQELPDFRWRLIGTHTTEIMRRDSTGREWRDLYGDANFAEVALGPCQVLLTGLPCRTLVRAPDRDRNFLVIESVDMPLSTDGSKIDMILAFNHAH
jgi:hypothetical protein